SAKSKYVGTRSWRDKERKPTKDDATSARTNGRSRRTSRAGSDFRALFKRKRATNAQKNAPKKKQPPEIPGSAKAGKKELCPALPTRRASSSAHSPKIGDSRMASRASLQISTRVAPVPSLAEKLVIRPPNSTRATGTSGTPSMSVPRQPKRA